ncbi:MAG TPA: response regulator transcription factor [bacterium]|nr:response regulator transcription factor [bacterium]HPN43954.1 response regulator transcription factor [bacterium]
MLKLLVADDHAIVRRGLIQIISEAGGILVVGEAGRASEVYEILAKTPVDILLLDINLPGINGLEILKQVRNDYPDISVLILTMFPEEQFAFRAFKGGASGYLTKESAPEELIRALQKISSGGKYLSASLAEKLACYIGTKDNSLPHQTLSDREFQVMKMLAASKTVSEIAQELHLSVKTISTYRARILQKMRMNKNADITQYAITNKLLD